MADVNWGALLDADPRLQAPLRSRGLRIRPTVAPSVDWGAMLDAEAEQEMERPAPQQQAPLPPPPQSRQQPAPQPAPQPKAIEYQGTIYEFSPDWDDAKIVDWFTNSQYSPMKQPQQAPAQQQFAAPALQTQASPQQPAMTPELEQAKQTYLSLLDKIESGQPASKEEYDALHRTAAVLDSAGVSEQAVFAGRKQPVWNPPQVESGPKTPIETEQQKHQKRLESGSKAALSFAREELAKSWFPNLRAVSESAHNEWISLAKRAVGKDQEADYSQVIADAWGQAADEIAQGGMVPAALERGMRNVLRVLPDMVVAGQVAGPYGALGLAGVQEGNRAITKGRKAGLSGGKLGTYVATQAGLEFAIGAVLQRAGLGGTETMAAAKQIAAKSLSDAGKQLAKTTGQELLEEIPTELSHNVADWAYNVDPTAMSMEQLGQTLTDTIIGTVMQSGAVSIPNVAGGAMAGRAARLEKLKGVQAKGFVSEQDAKDLGLPPEASTNRKTRGAAVKDEINQLEQEIKDAESVAAGVPTDASGVQGTTQMGVVPGEDGLPPAAGVPGAGTVTTPPAGVPPAVGTTTETAVPPDATQQTPTQPTGQEGQRPAGIPPLKPGFVRVVHMGPPGYEDSFRQGLDYSRHGMLQSTAREWSDESEVEYTADDPRFARGTAYVYDVPIAEIRQHHNVTRSPGKVPGEYYVGSVPPTGAEQAAREQAGLEGEGTGLERLGESGAAIVDNFYDAILQSIKTTWRVPEQERNSAIGAAWRRARGKMTPEEFVDQLRTQGPDSIFPAKEVSDAVKEQEAAQVHAGDSALVAPEPGQAPRAEEEGAEVPIGVENRTPEGFQVAKQQANDARDNKPLLKWAVENLQPGDTFVNSLDGTRYTVTSVTVSDDKRQVYIESEHVAIGDEGVVGGGTISVSKDGKITTAGDPTSAMHDTPYTTTEGMSGVATVGFEPSKSLPVNTDVTTLGNYVQRQNKPFDSPRRVRKVVYRNNGETRVFVEGESVAVKADELQPVRQEAGGQIPGQEQGKEAEVPDLDAAKELAGEGETSAEGTESSAAKEPWMMTREEWWGEQGRAFVESHPDFDNQFGYEMLIEAAVKAGKDVPLSVRKQADRGVKPWEWTRDEFLRDKTTKKGTLGKPRSEMSQEEAIAEHQAWIERAVRDGKPVPAEVLADYPDLAPTSPQTPAAAEPAPEPAGPSEAAGATVAGQETGVVPKSRYTDMTPKELNAEAKRRKLPIGKKPDAMRKMLEADDDVENVEAEPPVEPAAAAMPKPELAPDTARIQAEKEAKEAAKREQQERVTSEGYAKLPEKSRTRFDAAWDGDDAQAMKALLDPSNKALRAEFERRAGVKLPRTIKGTGEAVDQVYAGRKPAAAPVATAANAETPAKSLGELATASSEARAKYDHYSTLAGQVGRGKLTLKQALDQAKVYPDGQAAKTKKDIIALAERSKQELVTADEAYKAASAAIPPRSAADIAAERAEESRRKIAEHDAEIKRNGEEEQERKRKEDQDRLKLARPVLQALETVEPAKGGVRDENGYATNRASPIFREAIDGKFTTAQLSEARLRLMSAGAPSAAIDAVESATPISEAPKAKSEKKSTPIEVYAGDDIRYVNSGGQEFTGTVKQLAPTGKNLLVVPDGANNSIEISPDKVVGVDRRGKVSQQKGLAPDVVIGPKSHSNPDVERILKREQDAGRPAWYDGSYFYLKAGKYQLRTDDNGETHFEQLHNLSEEGQMRHFDPSEYVAYNRAAAEKKTERDAKEKVKADELAAKEAEQRAITEKWNATDAAARQTIVEGAKATKGKSGTIEVTLADKSKETTKATIFGDIAVHKTEAKTDPWKVTHIPTGLGMGSTFATKGQAVEAAWLLNQGMDWSSKKIPDSAIREAQKRLQWFRFGSRDAGVPEFLGGEPVSKPESPAKGKGRKSAASAKPATETAPKVEPSVTEDVGQLLKSNAEHRKALDEVLGDYGPSGKYGDAHDAKLAKDWWRAKPLRWTVARQDRMSNPLFMEAFNRAAVGEYFVASMKTGDVSRLPYAILYKASDTEAVYVYGHDSVTQEGPESKARKLNKMGLPKISLSPASGESAKPAAEKGKGGKGAAGEESKLRIGGAKTRRKPVSQSEVQAAFPGSKITPSKNGWYVEVGNSFFEVQFTPEIELDEATQARIQKEAPARLQGLIGAAGSFSVVLPDGTRHSGLGLIRLAEDLADSKTVRHEAVHLAHAAGLFGDAEWQALVDAHANGATSIAQQEEMIAIAHEAVEADAAVWSRITRWIRTFLAKMGIGSYDARDVHQMMYDAGFWQRETQRPEGGKAYQLRARPDLANIGETQQARDLVDQVDEARNQAGLPERRADADVQQEADDRLARDYEGERANLLQKGQTGQQLDDVETLMAKAAFNREAEKAFASGKPEDLTAAMGFMEAYRNTGSEQGRAFRQRRDLIESPAERYARLLSEAILEPPEKMRHRRDEARRRGDHKAADKINEDWAKEFADLKAKLKALGIDLDNLWEHGYDKRKAAQAVRIIQTVKATTADKMYEYWRNSILSAVTTQAANVIGNIGNAGWHFTAERMTEAVLNVAMKRGEGAQLGEFKYILGGILPGLSRGARNFLTTWRTELPELERQIGRNQISKLETTGLHFAIGGKMGRVIRMPQRLLLAVDDFAKSMFVEMEVGARAYRIAKAEGKEGDALRTRIAQLTADLESPAWDQAYDAALELTFQQEGGELLTKVKRNVLSARRDIPGLRYLIPFVVTPANIFAEGLSKSPLGSVAVARSMYQNYKNGNPVLKGQSAEVAQQVLAWAITLALMGMLDDDDPWITGTEPAMTRGGREVSYRTRPAMSIKLGDNWYSYSRIEPFATAIGLTVDWLNALRSGDAERTIKLPFNSLVGQLRDKTFLSGIGDIVEAMELDDPVNSLAKWASNFTTSWVPNIVRSGIREADQNVMQTRVWGKGSELYGMIGKRTGQKAGIPVAKKYPIYDVWGRPAQRSDVPGPAATDWLYRMVVPSRVQKDEMFVADRVLINWNNQHPDDKAAFPMSPMPYYTKAGKKHYMTDQEYADYCRVAGEIARKPLENWRPERIETPKQSDIDRIEAVIRDARETAKARLF